MSPVFRGNKLMSTMQKLCNNGRRQFLPAFRVFKNRHDKNGAAGRKSHVEETTVCENASLWSVPWSPERLLIDLSLPYIALVAKLQKSLLRDATEDAAVISLPSQ